MAKSKNTVKTVKAAKNLHKKNPKLFYAIAALVVVAVIVTGVLYYLKPELFKGPMPAEGELTVYFLDVGQGDCIYIAFPDGKDMLIDCGSEKGTNKYRESSQSDLKSLVTDGQIDYLMATHSDTDHVSYLDEVLETYEVKNVYMPFIKASAESKAEAIAALPQEKLAKFTDPDTIGTVVYAEFFIAALSEPDCNVYTNVGVFDISGEGYKLTFYCLDEEYFADSNLKSPEKINAVSPIGILEYAGRRIVFTGDSNEINEKEYCEKNYKKDCDVLKVAHHGSETSSTADFLDMISCEYAVISVGEGNSYGHPTAAALSRFEEKNMQVYRTDQNGNVILKVKNTGDMTFDCEKAAA